MVGFVGNLRAKLGLDTAEFQAKMRASQQEARGFSASIGQGLMTLRTGALGLAAVGAAAAGTAAAARNVVREIAAIGDEARRAGLGVEAFQRWAFVAEQNRIGIDAMVDGFKELNLRADEWIATRAGPAAEAFQRLGFSADDLRDRLRDPSELMLEIFRRAQGLERAAQIRVFDEILGGTGGERFVQLIDQGESGLRRTLDRAHEVGRVMSEDLVDTAVDLDRRFSELATSVGGFFKWVAVGVADFVLQVANLRGEMEAIEGLRDQRQGAALLGAPAAEAIAGDPEAAREHADTVRELVGLYERLQGEGQTLIPALRRVSDELHDIGQTDAADSVSALASGIETLGQQLDTGEISASDYEGQMHGLVVEAEEAMRTIGDLDTPTFTRVLARLGELGQMLGRLTDQATTLRGSLPGGPGMTTGVPLTTVVLPQDQLTGRRASAPPRAPNNIDFGLPPAASGGGGASEGYAGAVADIRARTEALLAEATALSEVAASGLEYGQATEYARVRAEALAALHEEGRAVTPALAAEIDTLARAYASAGNNVETLRDQLQRAREDGQRGAEALANIFGAALQGGDAARGAVARLISEIARMQALRGFQALASGGGVLGRFFGGLGSLIGKNARGTESWRGGLTVVGEEGSELVDLPTGARITPALETSRLLREGVGGRIELVVHAADGVTIEKVGQIATGVALRVVQGGLSQSRATLPQQISDMDNRGV